MFDFKANGNANAGNANAGNGLSARARGAGATAAQSAQTAAQGVSSAAQVAAQGVGNSFRQGVYSARGWTAPRLENAADYCTTTVAPRVSAALRTTAKQVSPEDAQRQRGLRSPMSWSFLALALLAAAGAVTALLRRRYSAAIDAETEPDAAGAAAADPAAPVSYDGPVPETAAEPGTDTGADGRVSTS